MAKKNNDISVDTLKELVKTHGDSIVTGVVRRKKVKECKGFKDAEDKAALKLSHIVAGRILQGNRYVAVIRFKAIFFILLLLCLLPVLTLFKNDTKAKTREDSAPAIITGDSDTMDIPGYPDVEMDSNSKGLLLYNPHTNPCNLIFYIVHDGAVVWESDALKPGEEVMGNIYSKFKKGVYEIEIITAGVTEEGQRLNSVSQKIKLQIKEE